MIQNAVAQFSRSPDCEAVHLPFFFTPDVRQSRQGNIEKLRELFLVVARLLKIRSNGPIALTLYPTGGPQRIPVIRDLLLLPWIFLCTRRVVLHFHAAGIAERFCAMRVGLLERSLRWLYRKAFAAVVMTEFNRRDPEAAGIQRVLVIPHRIEDSYDPLLVRRDDSTSPRILYLGHLCADKGTPEMLQAFAAIRTRHPGLVLELVGECLPPFSDEDLTRLISSLELQPYVEKSGVLTGRAKNEAFGRADLFAFPSVAPYESFGLVLIEAMAWGLPIVASDWRGNREVLTPEAGAIFFPVSPSPAGALEAAFEEALSRRDEWAQWGEANRRIFAQRYCESGDAHWLTAPILSLLRTAG
jgi:glycosyltransferase involved in cell wall biosynthesis